MNSPASRHLPATPRYFPFRPWFKRAGLLTLLCCLAIGIVKADAGQPQTATVTINAASKLGPVNKLVFGTALDAGDARGIFRPITDSQASVYENTCKGGGVWDPETREPVPGITDFSKDHGFSIYRYPGGCDVHNYEWKKTVGPVEDRPNWKFGLGEFLEFCHQSGAEVLMQVPDYVGTKEDAADLVEYLNEPATPDHPWAMKRSEWGHPEPYHVRFFELGNESDHGNHQLLPPKKFDAEQYSDWALSYIAAMKKVDPTIKISVLSATNLDPYDPWNKTVYSKAGPAADFIVDHTYPIGIYREGAQIDEDRLGQAAHGGRPPGRISALAVSRSHPKVRGQGLAHRDHGI